MCCTHLFSVDVHCVLNEEGMHSTVDHSSDEKRYVAPIPLKVLFTTCCFLDVAFEPVRGYDLFLLEEIVISVQRLRYPEAHECF